ncbi:MAG: hypothetical protein AAB531_02645 [Patescibacteria group bacterium]
MTTSPEQMKFGVRKPDTTKAKFSLPKTPKEVHEHEGPYWLEGMVSLTEVVRSFSQGQEGSQDDIPGRLALGSAVGRIVMIGEMIYGERDWYCSDETEHPEKSVKKLLPDSYPTGGDFHDLRRFLEKFRPIFQKAEEGHRPYEREEIKRKLHDVWVEIAANFDLGSYFRQSMMTNTNGIMLPSGKTATSEDVAMIAKRIIDERFDTLVMNDPDYYGVYQPGFAFRMLIEGKIRHLYARPDKIDVWKSYQATTQGREKKGQIVTKIMVGDFKNSRRELFENPNSPRGKAIRLTRMVNENIARKFDWNLLVRNSRTHGWSRKSQRVFLITSDTPDSFPPDQTGTRFICFNEEGEEMILEMPRLTTEEKELATQDLRDYFAKAA